MVSRRQFLAMATGVVAATTVPLIVSAGKPRFTSRKLKLYNIHTQETFEGTYWREGEYDAKALKRLDYVLRDRRNQQQHAIDPELFDVLHRLQAEVDAKDAYQIICGYRSHDTNKKLRQTSTGVARNSLHCVGKAIDLRLDSIPLKDLRDVARTLKAGGVGYYPKSNFIHIDKRAKPAAWG